MTCGRTFQAICLLLAIFGGAVLAKADESLVLYGGGSLREAMSDVALLFNRQHGVPVRTEFGASGRMRERIEAGDTVDVITSADICHAKKLVQDGRASVLAMFAQNALCLLAPSRLGSVAPGTIVNTLIRPDLRIGVSPAKIDPLGDYTFQLFDMVEAARSGSRATLAERSVVLDNPPGSPPAKSGDYVLDVIDERRGDMAIVYCSGRGRYERLSTDLAMVAPPDELQVGPQYGLAVMRHAKPAAAWLALTILSPEGQAVLAKHGFRPVGLPAVP